MAGQVSAQGRWVHGPLGLKEFGQLRLRTCESSYTSGA